MTPTIRTAEPRDLDQIAALLTERGEPADAVDHRLVVERVGWDCCAVAVDGDRVVSTATLLDETVTLGGVELPAGQVELVATDREYEGRGLVRALMDWAHERSARRGHLLQVMIGIPYFYRQFGYTYAIPIDGDLPVLSFPEPGDGHVVRPAVAADIPTLAALQDAAQALADVRMPHSTDCWHWLIDRDGSTTWIVERDGQAVATGRSTPPEEGGVRLTEIAGSAEGIAALAAEVKPETVAQRGGLDGFTLGEPNTPNQQMYYVRIPDAVPLLEALRPVLAKRVDGLPEGEAVVSFYRSHVRFAYGAGEVGPMVAGGAMQAPYSVGGAGVAPDHLAELLFGPLGIEGMTRRYPDVYLGPNRELMAKLFPPVRSDMLTFYMP